MAEKENKELKCREEDCYFMARGETDDEVFRLTGEHACLIHHLCDFFPELKKTMKPLVRKAWRQGEDPDSSKEDPEIPHGGERTKAERGKSC